MNRQTLPIHEIQIIDRQRIDLGDINDLCSSIQKFGLIQPIIVNQEKRLIAGGRRMAACIQLGHKNIDVVFRETLSTDELHELELEENIRRKEMSWQEKCLNINTIHNLKSRRSALEGIKWAANQTAEMLSCSGAHIHYNREIAVRLIAELTLPKEQRKYWQCETMSDAWRLRLRDEEEMLQADLAKDLAIKSKSQALPPPELNKEGDPLSLIKSGYTTSNKVNQIQLLRQRTYISLTLEEARQLYLSNPLNPPDEFDQYYQQKLNWLRQKDDTITISHRLHNISCIDFMNNPGWKESVDHIITDPPYGIEMDNLEQSNTGMSDIDTVSAEHVVQSNEQLFQQFFPAAFNVLKPNGFLILFCDIMQWQNLYNLATSAGFKVQRWPITWVKTHRCMNQMAMQNFTKSTEIAMVCRKGTATLSTTAGECHILASHDEFKDQLGHPFVKPFALWEYIIDHVSYEGQVILEPFAGRGSGVLSILKKNRLFYSCEVNPQHFNALVENVKQHYLKVNPNYKFE